MCAPSPPPSPDYGAAAQAQGAANLEAARAQGRINNPNVIAPTGTQTVTWDGDTPTLTQTYSPQEQALYDQNSATRLALSKLGGTGAGALGEVIGKNLDLSGAPQAPGSAEAVRNSVINAMMSRSNKDLGDQEQNTRANLIAAGIPVTSEAFGKEMDRIDRARNDARSAAELAGGAEAQRQFGMGTDARKNAIAEILAQRQTPLNEITALMSGSQVSNPFSMPGYAQNTNVAAAPVFAGAQAQGAADMNAYNQQVAGNNAMMSGLFGLGSAAIGAPVGTFMKPSDRRLKSNIVHIGQHPSGLNWYEYDIFGQRQQGVMAQEAIHIRPDAVHMMDNGYYAVDYGRL